MEKRKKQQQIIINMQSDNLFKKSRLITPDILRNNYYNSKLLQPRKPIHQSNYDTTKKVWKSVVNTINDYFTNSNMHGLRYVGDKSLPYIIRFMWIFCFFIALAFAVYFITSIFNRFKNSPVIISQNPFLVPIDDIPFPAITICNLNQALKKEALIVRANGSKIDNQLLDDYCDIDNENSSYTADRISWSYVKKFLRKINQPCSQMLKHCKWRNDIVNCSKFFSAAFTDDGLCCAFNQLPLNFTSNFVENDSDKANRPAVDWTPRGGYPKYTPKDAIPLKAEGTGMHMGLTVVIDANLNEFYCSSYQSVGFKILLSNAIERPKMADTGFLLSPQKEYRIVITPEIYDAVNSLIDVDYKKRQCYFPRERSLKYFKIYTQQNCHLECQTNFTMLKCKCTPYYLPKDTTFPICGQAEQNCVDLAFDNLDSDPTFRIDKTPCGCLQGCFELKYNYDMSDARMTNDSVRGIIRGNISTDYFVDNMAIIRFYFVENQFKKYTKSELFGFTELLSNCGGLLGLFLGFSFLSIIEFFYHIIAKIVEWQYMKKKENDTNKTEISGHNIPSYPYYN